MMERFNFQFVCQVVQGQAIADIQLRENQQNLQMHNQFRLIQNKKKINIFYSLHLLLRYPSIFGHSNQTKSNLFSLHFLPHSLHNQFNIIIFQMQKGFPRLWKKIGSHSHHSLQLSSQLSINHENQPLSLKNGFQQICLPTEESVIRGKQNQLSFAQCCRDCLQQLSLLGDQQQKSNRGNKKEVEKKMVGESSYELKEMRKDQVSFDEQVGKSKENSKWMKLKFRKCLESLKDAIAEIKVKIKQLDSEIKAEKNKTCEQVAQNLNGLVRNVIAKFEQSNWSNKLHKKIEIREKQLQNKISELDLKIIAQRFQSEKLKKQIDILTIQRNQLFRENGDLYEKLFDLQQKVLGVDLEVQKRLSEILKLSVGTFATSKKTESSLKAIYDYPLSQDRHLSFYNTLDSEDPSKAATQRNHLPRLLIHKDQIQVADPIPKSPASSLKYLFSCNQQKFSASPKKHRKISYCPNRLISSNNCGQRRIDNFRMQQQSPNTSVKSSRFVAKKIGFEEDKKGPNISEINQKIKSIRQQMATQMKNMTNMRGTSKSFNR